MRTALALIPCLLATVAFAQQPEHATPSIDPAKLALIEDMISLAKIDEMIPQMFDRFKQNMRPMMDEAMGPELLNSSRGAEISAELTTFEDRLFALLKQRLDFAKLKPQFVKIYDETLTKEELEGVVTFYKSPAGQAVLRKMPQITAKSVDLSTKLMRESMADVQDMSASWVAEMKQKYGTGKQ
jgi:hypothetical protein